MITNADRSPNLRWRVLLVTFDLTGTRPGDPRYRAADDAMSAHGTLFKPIKQIRFLLTNRSSKLIRGSIEQRTGKVTIMITPLTRTYQLSVRGNIKRREMAHFLAAARAVGLDTRGFDTY